MLYGDSGNGKSSLINAGLLPDAARLGFHPERLRVQPLTGGEVVLERIAVADDDSEYLPTLIAPEDDQSPRVVLSTEAFEERVREACKTQRPLLIFDQFEEILTLFEDASAGEAQRRLVEMLVTLQHEPLPVKLLFAFREDHLGKVKQILGACPELVDQALRLGPPAADALATIIRGPFERYPGHFERELEPELAERLHIALAERFGAGDLSLSEVQTVCLRLWQADDPQTLLGTRSVQGLLEDYLGEALDAFTPELRGAAVALLAQMVTSAGTRNVISADDLQQRVREEEDIAPRLLDQALERLESESRLVRRERRRDIYLYEITSEFLVPWISQRRDEARRLQERRRERRRAGLLLIVVVFLAGIAVWALGQRSDAQRQAKKSTALALAATSAAQIHSRPDVSLLLALEAYRTTPSAEARSSANAALAAAQGSGVRGILRGHTGTAYGVVVSPDGRTLASASADNTVRLWDARTHRQLGGPLTGHVGTVWSVAFSPDGRTLASAGKDQKVRLWDARTHRQLGRLTGHVGTVWSVAFSPDGRTLASGGGDKTVRLWEVRTHRQLRQLTGHKDRVVSVAFSPDGRMLASGSFDRTVRLWDFRTHRQLGQRLSHDDLIYSVAFSPDGRTVASTGADSTVRLWGVRTHRQLGEPLTGHVGIVFSVAFSRDGRALASAGADTTVRVLDVRTDRGGLTGHTNYVRSVAFSHDGRTLASASNDRTIRLWDPRTHGQLRAPLTGHAGKVYRAVFSPDGRTLASASEDKTVRLWDVRTHRALGKLTGHLGTVYSVAFSPDGRTLASGGADGTVRLWDVRTHRQRGRLTGHKDHVRSVAFSPDGRTLASASEDKTIRLWDVRTNRQRGQLVGHQDFVFSVTFSPDGRKVASASYDNTVRLWDGRTHEQLGEPLTGHTLPVYSVAFSPDGRTLASAGNDETIRLWDVRNHQHVGTLTGLTQVLSLAFSPNGTLASGEETEIRLREGLLWRDYAGLRNEVCNLVSTGLSKAEWDHYGAGTPYRQSCS